MNLLTRYPHLVNDLPEKEIIEIDKRLKLSLSEKFEYLQDGLVGVVNVLLQLQWFTNYNKMIDFLIRYDIKGELLYLIYNDVAKRDYHVLGNELQLFFILTQLSDDTYELDYATNKLSLVRKRKSVLHNLIYGITNKVSTSIANDISEQ